MASLNELRDDAHAVAVSKGWHDQPRSVGELLMLVVTEVAEAMEAYREGCEPDEMQYTVKQGGPTMVGVDPGIGVVPTADAYNHPTHGLVVPVKDSMGRRTVLTAREALAHGIRIKPDGIPAELVDTIIRILDFAGLHGIDLDTAFEQKMTYNAGRSYRHGGKRL